MKAACDYPGEFFKPPIQGICTQKAFGEWILTCYCSETILRYYLK